MRSVEDQLSLILQKIKPLEAFEMGLLESRGCVITENVTAPWPLPAYDAASVDGYAVRLADVSSASQQNPVSLDVVDVVQSGARPGRLIAAGTAVRVSAGASLPEETEAVIPMEFTDSGSSQVQIFQAAVLSQYIRRRGEDIAEGELVAPAGQVVDARLIGLFAAIGRGSVVARPRPRVVIITVGDELIEAGNSIEPGKVMDTNGIMLAAACAEAGATVFRVGPVAEDIARLRQIFEDQVVRADLIITIGGTSASAYDVLHRALSDVGNVEYTRIAMQPGSAQGFAIIGEDRIPVLTLPGNPVAAFVSFEVFVLPVLRKMQGKTAVERTLQRAVADNTFSSVSGRRQYVRALRDPKNPGHVTALDVQGAHLVASLARTDCLIVVPEMVEEVRAGDAVSILVLADETVW